jgi:hypothetical protein
MRKILAIFTIFLLLILASGCADKLVPPNTKNPWITPVTTNPSQASVAKYVIGDIVIKNPGDDMGEVITDYYAASNTYTSQTVIFDKYGTVFFYGGGTSLPAGQFEAMYPHKRAHIDNPYELKTFVKAYYERYGVNSVATKYPNDIEGIKIIAYDYPRDTYTYVYVSRQGGTWVNRTDTLYNGARTDIETKYKY